MKLTVLADNNTLTDQYFLAEPALSFYIEDSGKKILFDAGYSDVFIKNAATLGIDLKNLDFVIFCLYLCRASGMSRRASRMKGIIPYRQSLFLF